MTSPKTPEPRPDITLLRSRGFALCRPDPVEKKPTYSGWSTASLEVKDFNRDDQVGVMGGPLSSGGKADHALVILDLDIAEVLRLAGEYLPPTGMMEGRPSKPNSHRYFLIPFASIPPWALSAAPAGSAAAKRKTGCAGPFIKVFPERETGKEAIRFLGTGGQVVCPPSIHPEGEHREWEGGTPGEPAIVPFPDLWRATCELAAACACQLPLVGPQPPRGRPTRVPTPVRERVIAYLAKCPGSVSGAGGHNQAFKTARLIVGGFDLEPHEALEILSRFWNPTCTPEWSERELQHKVDDANRIPFDKKRGWLRDAPLRNGHVAKLTPKGAPASPKGETGEERQNETPTQPEDWEEPISLDDPNDPPPLFPLDALPGELGELCSDIGETIGCPPDYAACFALAAIAGTCGAARVLNVKSNWEEHASLYVCAVAPPNGGKTPSFKIITRPIIDEQCKRTENKDKNPAYVSDVTVEKLASILHDEPRGTILLRDELAGWIKGMDQYKARGGGDRQFWLSAWSNDPVSVHRKNPDAPHVFVPHPCVSVAGGIQPEVLSSLRGNDDGFFDRILFTYPLTLPARGEDWKCCKQGLLDAWQEALGTIRKLDMAETNGNRRPEFIGLADPAKKRWEHYTETLADRINNPEFPKHLQGVAGKLKGYGARLALVSMLLRIGYESADPLGNVSDVDVTRSHKLCAYFLGHAERAYSAMGRDTAAEHAKKVLNWIQANEKPTFTRRDVHRGLRVTFPKPELLADPLRRLIQHGYLRYGAPADNDTGRRPTTTYEVHPEVFKPVVRLDSGL